MIAQMIADLGDQFPEVGHTCLQLAGTSNFTSKTTILHEKCQFP